MKEIRNQLSRNPYLHMGVKRTGLVVGPLLFFIIKYVPWNVALPHEMMSILAVAAWMVVWWVTEAVHLAVTALLPIVLFPVSGISSTAEATAPYANRIVFLFMGGFIMALALEKWQMHKRIALHIVKWTGSAANRIILGFMLATALLSMWLSNTATTVMMLPIAISVMELLTKKKAAGEVGKKARRNFNVSLLLGIAYAANIGGTSTLIGTPPNAVMANFMDELHNQPVDFGRWMLVAVPFAAVLLLVAWFLLVRIIYPNRIGKMRRAKEVIESGIRELKPMAREEWWVSVLFTLTALTWVFKNPINQLIGSAVLDDAIIGMTGGMLMLVLPVTRERNALLKWTDMKNLPWGILILFGGGLSLAKGLENTGVIQLVGNTLSANSQWPVWAIILALTATMLYMTELMSNVALTNIFIPVVLGIAAGLGQDLMEFAVPVTLAASCAFMMPVSTPPNAIVFSSGKLKVRQMVVAGFWINLLSLGMIMLLLMWVNRIF